MATKKILLIEDDEILSRVMAEELIEAGFEVSKAYDGESGLEMARSKKPDAVFLDLLLPKKSGFEVLKELKSAPGTNAIPVIIISMLGADEDIKKGLQLGAIDYIVKSQHALTEIVEKAKEFFSSEQALGKK
ncbi:MAG: response regulator [Parcubacteria group bacterium]|nr:response regulator [Parcubacteria group bacterium]